jgi:hypothetical protein
VTAGYSASLAPLEAWRQLRDAYWEEVCPIPQEVPPTESPPERPDLVPLVKRPDILLSAEVVNVWLGVDLDNQMFLAWLLELAAQIGLDPQRIRVVQFERHPVTGEPVMDVGELGPEVAADHPTPASLTSPAVDSLRAAWAAIAAPEPSSLLRYIEAHAESPTVFHRAFSRILGRFPCRDRGLNRWELELLRRVPTTPIKAGEVIELAIKACEGELDRGNGLYLEDRLRRLSSPRLPRPLLERSGSTEVFSIELALTDAGRSVLHGQANAVDLNGIDDWVGGTHLQSTTDRVWFRRDSLVAGKRRQPELPD